jgi:Protein of unknown function (DUF3987)
VTANQAASQDDEFAGLCVSVATELWGKPNPALSKRNKLRWGKQGSRSIDASKGVWFDHENGEGGGTIDLICRECHCDKRGALAWLERKGMLNGRTSRPPPRLVETYDYVDENGTLLFQVCRYEPKEFLQRRQDSNGKWIWKLAEVRRVLYRLPKVRAAIAAKRGIIIVEGEKDVHSLEAIDMVGTSNPGGAGKWLSDYSETLRGAAVAIVADNDAVGRKHAHEVAAALHGIAADVRVIDLVRYWPGMPEKCDVTDWITKAGGTKAALWEIRNRTPIWSADQAPPQGEHPFAGEQEGPFNSGRSDQGFDQPAEWPEPKPLPSGLLPVDAFDTEFLPATIGPWVLDIADRLQCPMEYVGVPAMVALGSLIGRRIGIRPQRRTDWLEVPNLWGCIVGRPGTIKSPAMAEALKPLQRLEIEAQKSNDRARKAHAIAIEAHKIKTEVAQARAKEAVKKGENPADALAVEKPPEPKDRRYIANDCTYEALGVICANNPNGVLTFRDELVSLLKVLDREEHAAARGFFLTAWGGKAGYTFDRITRGLTHIEAACVSMLGSTQPGRLAEYIDRAVNGEAGDDGLIQRFGLLVWPDGSPDWTNVDRYPNTAARQAAWDAFQALNQLTPDSIGAESDPFETIPFLQFDDEALQLFEGWRADLEARLRSGEMHPALEGHLAKYKKLVPALALIGHLADGGTEAIGANPLLRALAFGKYLESHAKRCYGAGREVEATAARLILAHIRRGNLRDGFTARDVQRHGWSGLTRIEPIKAALALLVDLNWLAEVTPTAGPAGGRPSSSYRINPGATRQ